MNQEPQTIVRLTAQNVLRLSALTCAPNGAPMVLVEGRNEAGKTSALRTIEMALGGAGMFPPEPVKRGKERAEIVLETQKLRVKRTISAKGTTSLNVESIDGSHKYAKPQAVLDELLGSISFDPLAFANKSPKDQVDILKHVLGLAEAFATFEEQRKLAYDERTNANRELKQSQARLQALPSPKEETPEEEIDVAALVEQLRVAREQKSSNDMVRRRAEDANNHANALSEDIVRLTEELEEARERFKQAEERYASLQKEVETLADPDISSIEEQIKGTTEANKAIREKKEYASLAAVTKEKEEEVERLTGVIKAIEAAKAERIAKSKIPVEGLTFDETGVFLNGVPFSQCSQAQRIRTSCAIGVALNPELKILLVRDGSLLDADNMQALYDIAASSGAQIWVERVADNENVQVVIVDETEPQE